MNLRTRQAIAARFKAYVGELTKVIGHADREGPLHDYCAGLLATEGRRSVEPMAAVTEPAHVSAQHQKLLHLVANSPWSDERMLAKVRELVVPSMTWHGPIEAWIIDDTSFPKKGRHSVGVHHQYCGQLGKQANCQVAVTLSIANHHASLPIAYRLYLPRDWINDRFRRVALCARARCADPGRSTVRRRDTAYRMAQGRGPLNSGSQPSIRTCRSAALSTSPSCARKRVCFDVGQGNRYGDIGHPCPPICNQAGSSALIFWTFPVPTPSVFAVFMIPMRTARDSHPWMVPSNASFRMRVPARTA